MRTVRFNLPKSAENTSLLKVRRHIKWLNDMNTSGASAVWAESREAGEGETLMRSVVWRVRHYRCWVRKKMCSRQ